jgi:hypothetical protein
MLPSSSARAPDQGLQFGLVFGLAQAHDRLEPLDAVTFERREVG